MRASCLKQRRSICRCRQRAVCVCVRWLGQFTSARCVCVSAGWVSRGPCRLRAVCVCIRRLGQSRSVPAARGVCVSPLAGSVHQRPLTEQKSLRVRAERESMNAVWS